RLEATGAGAGGLLMILRAAGWCLVGALALAPGGAVPQELALAPVTLQLPTTPPTLSPDCRSKRVAGDLFLRPLRALSRAVRAKRQVKVLAIGSSTWRLARTARLRARKGQGARHRLLVDGRHRRLFPICHLH